MAEKIIDDTKDELLKYIPMIIDNVCDYQYDEKMFSDGIDTGSYLAGVGTALLHMNKDMDIDSIVEILKCVIENNYGLESEE